MMNRTMTEQYRPFSPVVIREKIVVLHGTKVEIFTNNKYDLCWVFANQQR
jgi:hypothetical protein